jgi:hypothetical protein
MHVVLSLFSLMVPTLTPSYSGRQARQPVRGEVDQGGGRNLADDLAQATIGGLNVPSNGWAGSPAASSPTAPKPNAPSPSRNNWAA